MSFSEFIEVLGAKLADPQTDATGTMPYSFFDCSRPESPPVLCLLKRKPPSIPPILSIFTFFYSLLREPEQSKTLLFYRGYFSRTNLIAVGSKIGFRGI